MIEEAVEKCDRRRSWATTIEMALVTLPVLYVLSSGPLQLFALQKSVTYLVDPDQPARPPVPKTEVSWQRWFERTHYPLFQFYSSDLPGSGTLRSYWDLFACCVPAQNGGVRGKTELKLRGGSQIFQGTMPGSPGPHINVRPLDQVLMRCESIASKRHPGFNRD